MIEIAAAGNLCDLFAAQAITHPDRAAVSWRTARGVQTLSWFAYRERVLSLAGAFVRLGLDSEHTVAIFARNRVEHLLTDLAVLHCGATPVSVYPTMAPEQINHVLADCAPTLVIIDTTEQWERISTLAWVVSNRPTLVLLDSCEPCESTDLRRYSWAEVVALADDSQAWTGQELDERVARVRPDTAATVVYTSGTTGMPKGVVLTHANLLWVVDAMARTGVLDADYRSVSHLPLAHIAERLWSLYLPMRAGGHVFCCPDPMLLVESLRIHRPSFLMTVPRVWEKLRAVADLVMAAPEFDTRRADLDRERRLLEDLWQLRFDDQPVPAPLAVAAALAREGVLREVRVALGLDRVSMAVTGAAPMPHELRISMGSIGVEIGMGYGLTETAGVAVTDRFAITARGSVGLALAGAEIRIADDGEILLRSPGNTPGYLHRQDATAELYSGDWLRTGDIGFLDDAGRLHITARKKELLITSAGKNIAPAAIETRLWDRSFVSLAMAVGDGRPYVTALVTVDRLALAAFADAHHIAQAPLEQLLEHPAVLGEVDAVVAQANQALSRPEQVKRYRLLADTWSSETGELTPTFKLRRAAIAEKYTDVIDALYS